MCASILGRDLQERLARDIVAVGRPPDPGALVTQQDIAGFPDSVQRYLEFMGVPGRPAVGSFRAHLTCRFRTRPDRPFWPAEVWQYTRVEPLTRLFWMRIDAGRGLLPMVGRDSYLDGRGRMLGKLLDRIVVADGSGDPFDVGELTTWLNDAVLLMPSMLLRAGARFSEADDTTFIVEVTDAGRTVSARVVLDDRGAPIDFHTEDRYVDLPGGPVRTPWSTPTTGWQRRVDGRAIPARGSAIWHLPEGDFTYGVLEFAPDGIETDPIVTELPHRRSRGEGLRAVEGAVAIAATVPASPLVRARYNRWGATPEEAGAPMPGDELVPEPAMMSTRAVTIDAPPTAVWPWLAQMGHGRGGLYSYDALENLVGLDIHSADEILPQHQHLSVGDIVRLGKPGSPSFGVVALDPGCSLVLVSVDPATGEPVPTPVLDGAGATWQWVLRGVNDGRATRLISRQRNTHPPSQRVIWRLVEPVGFVMERRMLLGIQQRAERLWR